jgi:uncharacterized membrane protein
VVINDHGVVAGDGGYDSGLAWRYENGQYTVTGGVNGMPIAYLGGINNAGDIAGTARDAQLITPDYAFVDLRAGGLLSITPSGGSATDLNDQGQVCGYTNPVSGPFEAFRWDASGGLQPLGVLGLDNSLAYRMNDLGDVVGAARSASGNTSRAWVFTDALGMQELPAPFPNSSAAIGINNRGHVVGMSARSGPDLAWLWTGGSGVTEIATLFDPRAVNVNVISVLDINDAGQILLEVFDNNAVDFRTAILTPPPAVGDTNCDGTVDAFDIEPFTLALTDPNGYAGQYPNCDIRNVDINGDGVVDAFDIEPFVELLTP